MLVTSAFLILYTAIIVPVQICMWSYEDPCTTFITLPFDVIVDCFFLVAETAERDAAEQGTRGTGRKRRSMIRCGQAE
jgi:hypothetical protein